VLEVEALRAGYGRIPILNGVSFKVAAGEVVGVLGHNGMGKTTLMRTLIGHVPATGGTIRFDGADVTHEPTHARARRGLGYIPQGREIFPQLSVLDNLRMGASGRGREMDRAVAAAIEDFPALKPLLGRQGSALSGGEQQILAIARCLCAAPRLILLDEPTEGIQPSIVERIAESLLHLKRERGLTMVLVEQHLEFVAALSDRVFVLQKGVIIQEHDASRLADADVVHEIVGMGR
jgi:branched-chain amino acid transport system ATP-binding protein